MENKSILIQSDEVTKNMIGELQQDMIDSLSKVSKSMTEDVVQELRPIEKKISDFKREFQEFQEDNEDFGELIDDLNANLSKVSKSIESTIQESINKIIMEQNKVLNDNLIKLLAHTEQIKVTINNNEKQLLGAIENSTDNIIGEVKAIDINKIHGTIGSLESNIDHKMELAEQNLQILGNTLGEKAELLHKNVEEKIALLGKYIAMEQNGNKESILKKIDDNNINQIEERVELLGKIFENNLSNSEDNIIERVNFINEKIDEKNILIEIISKMENEFTSKINRIQEEVEWGNRSFFSRFFGKKR